MTAKMAFKAVLREVKRKSDAAVRTLANVTALIAYQRAGKSAPVEKKDRLFLFFQARLNCSRKRIFWRSWTAFT